jgi:hypothetical protein
MSRSWSRVPQGSPPFSRDRRPRQPTQGLCRMASTPAKVSPEAARGLPWPANTCTYRQSAATRARFMTPRHMLAWTLPQAARRVARQCAKTAARNILATPHRCPPCVIRDRFIGADVTSLAKDTENAMHVPIQSQVADQGSVGQQCKTQGHDGGRGHFSEPGLPRKSLQPNKKGQKQGNDEHLAGFDAEVEPD